MIMILVTATPVLLVFPYEVTIKTRAAVFNPLRNSARLALFSTLFQCCEHFVVLIIFRASEMEMGTSMNVTFISYCQNAEQSKENRVGLHSSFVISCRCKVIKEA